MSDIAIRIENLGKMYRIGGPQERYRTLRDSLTDAVNAPFKRARSLLRGQAYGAAGLEETIWALKDVSFEVKHGEVVGIIGRNGAGKSTLLKILSRITEPTEGYAEIYGRVGALLEVGTGFHPELTGRENIYLNSAILGMSREEINSKFDEIVAFAEVEKFIDTPVKHYSSGMGLRLGFAVAAHMEPEILLVDEVLAVGDIAFQKKCMGKMGDVASQGRTVLFVSHNMAAIKSLCSKGVLVDSGRIVSDGAVSQIINQYQSLFEKQSTSIAEAKGDFTFLKILFNKSIAGEVDVTKPCLVGVELNIRLAISNAWLFCIIRDAESNTIIHLRRNTEEIIGEIKPGSYTLEVELPPLWLKPGIYSIQFKLLTHGSLNKHRFLSAPTVFEATGTEMPEGFLGTLAPPVEWNLRSYEE